MGSLDQYQCEKFHILVRVGQCYSKLDKYENANKAFEIVVF